MSFGYHWKREEQIRWAEERLFRFVRGYVDRYHPHYRKLFRERGIDAERIYTYEDFARIPLTRKEDVQPDPKAFVLQPKMEGTAYEVEPLTPGKKVGYAARAFMSHYLRDLYGKPRPFREKVRQTAMYEWLPTHFNFSGGTTGMPASAVFTTYDLKKNVSRVHGMLYASGWGPEMRTLNLFPAVPHLAFFAPITVAFTVDTGGAVLHTCGGKAIPTERQVIIASIMGFEMITSLPSYLLYWLKTAVELKDKGWIQGLPGIRQVVVGAEPMTDEYRLRIKNLLAELGSEDVRVIEVYGMTEMKAGFFECGEKTGIHLNPELYFWEMLDPETEKPVQWGEPGVLVFSHIDWRGTVLLRYWTGDLIQGGMVWDRCPACGLTLPRIFTPIVRAEKDFTKVKGARVPLLELQRSLHGVEGLEAFQVVLGKEDPADPLSRDKVTVYACACPGAGEEGLRARILDSVRLGTEISPDEIVFLGSKELENRLFERTGLKADWVVDRREVTITSQAGESTGGAPGCGGAEGEGKSQGGPRAAGEEEDGLPAPDGAGEEGEG